MRFSIPEQLHFDQSRQFESKLLTEVCCLLNIQKSQATPYHQQSDRLVESSTGLYLICWQPVLRIILLTRRATSDT